MEESSSVEDNTTQRLIIWFYSTLVCSERQYVNAFVRRVVAGVAAALSLAGSIHFGPWILLMLHTGYISALVTHCIGGLYLSQDRSKLLKIGHIGVNLSLSPTSFSKKSLL